LQEQRSTNPLYRKLLRKIRKKRGISARQLAKEVGIDPSYVSKIETGAAPPPAWGVMLAINRALDSPELLEASEHAFLRHASSLAGGLLHRLIEMPPTLVSELGTDNVESWKSNTLEMLARIDTAYFSRVRWEDVPVEKRSKR